MMSGKSQGILKIDVCGNCEILFSKDGMWGYQAFTYSGLVQTKDLHCTIVNNYQCEVDKGKLTTVTVVNFEQLAFQM